MLYILHLLAIMSSEFVFLPISYEFLKYLWVERKPVKVKNFEEKTISTPLN